MWRKLGIAIMVISLGVFGAAGAHAQLAIPPAGFDMIGFIQQATRANVGAGPVPNRLRGGTLTINGIEMIVPNNSIVQMPAAAFSWADLFGPRNSTPVGNYSPARLVIPAGRTGLALADAPRMHFPSYEVRVVGNILTDPTTGAQTYIVGMILPASQQGLNMGSGLINFIDYDGTVLGGVGQIPGRFRVGGVPGVSTTGTLCELNDPAGRYGAAHSPDPRFSCDTSNPTITTASGYPVGIPFPDQNDPLRPATQRPVNTPVTDPFLAPGAPLRYFVVPAPGPGVTPDSRLQMPLMVGDWVDFSGTLMKLDPLGNNLPANMFVSVHSLTAHLGIQTTPGSNPAYIRVEAFVFGSGPTPQPATAPAQETSSRVQLVVFATDPTIDGTGSSPGTHVNAVVVDPATGAESELLFPNGDLNDNPKPPNHNGLEMDDTVRGRIRLQLNRNFDTTTGNKVGPGNYYREYIVRLGPGTTREVPNVANGLTAGRYRLPMFDYIFAEGAKFGEPIPPYNFNQFGFLAVGSGRLDGTTGPFVGPLDPFPGP